MNLSTECLGTAQVELLLQGNLTPDEYTSAQEHMEVCEQCRRRIEETIGPEQWWGDVQSVLLNSRGSLFSKAQATADDAEPNDTPTAKLLDLLGPTDDPNMLGRIGPYEIIGLLGQGGMGAVFKGFDRSLNRFVAIKMLLPHLAASGAARKRFAREGQAVAAVVDDHVMAIHCVDEWQGVPYLVMTYSRGVSLQKRLSDNGPLEVREILRIGMQAAKGLAAAHAQGIVHRDIKPANIFLDQNVERVQLMDFGLARAVDDASLTRSGTLAGTPQYMSPEQARAETVDHLSDLFSLGSVMYAMCTGHAPFRAESSYSVLRLITDKEPRPIREINSDIPEWLCAITSKLMAKQASDRFASAQEVAQLLEDCLAHVQQPAAIPLPVGVQALAAQSRSSSTESLQANRLKAKHQRIPPIGKFIAAAAGSFALIFAGVLVVLELNKGTLTIECDADDVPIRIMQGDNVVERMTVSKSPQNVRIAAGNYVVEVDGDFQGVTIKDGRVSLTRHGVATVEISKNAKLVLASNFQPGNIDGLRFGGRHERIDPRNRGYANIQVAEPGETNKYFASFPTLGNGIEEVGLLVSVEPPHEPTEPSNWKSYLVRASGIRRIRNYSACEASVEGKSFFKLDDEPYTVGYFQLQLDGEEEENVTVDMIAGSAHVNINYVVGLPNEQVRKVLKLDAPNKHSESWLSVNLQTRPQSAWASHLMKLDGWEYDRTRGVPNMIQREVALRSGETQTVTIEPADVRDVLVAQSAAQSTELELEIFQRHLNTTDRIVNAFKSAAASARKDGKPLNSLYLLAALIRHGSVPAIAEIAEEKNIAMKDLMERCNLAAQAADAASIEQWQMLAATADDTAKQWKHDYCGTEHLLMALIADGTLTRRFLSEQGIEAAAIRDTAMQIYFSLGRDAPVVRPLPEQPAPRPEMTPRKPDQAMNNPKPKRLQIREAAIVEADAGSSHQSDGSKVVEFSGMRLRLDPAQPAILTEEDIMTVESTDPNNPKASQIVLTLTPEAGERFLIETTRLSSQPNPGYLVIEFDGIVLSAPRVNDKISSKVAITASKDDDMERLVAAIRESIATREKVAKKEPEVIAPDAPAHICLASSRLLSASAKTARFP